MLRGQNQILLGGAQGKDETDSGHKLEDRETCIETLTGQREQPDVGSPALRGRFTCWLWRSLVT